MLNVSFPIYLASKSPRRKKLLKQLKIDFKVINIDVDELNKNGESPESMVKRLSLEKLEKAKEKKTEGIIITADTIVVLNREILGKPKNKKDAKKILKKLNGKMHSVYTGFSVLNNKTKKIITDYEKTEVTFRKIQNDEIDDYISSGTPMDKAGAYGIQDDFGAVFIKKINGDYYNVVGLPLCKLYDSLKKIL